MISCGRSLIVLTRASKSLRQQLPRQLHLKKSSCQNVNKKIINCPLVTRQLSTQEETKNFADTGSASGSKDLESTENTAPKKPDYNAITNGDKELEHKLKVLMLEAEVMRQEGLVVPPQSFITTEMWKELLQKDSRSSRRKYLTYLFKISKTKEKRKLKQLERKQEFEEKKPLLLKKSLPLEEHALHYGLQHNNIFLRIHDQTMNRMENNKLIQAMQFGEKIVIDCSYHKNMTKRENINCAKQLMLVFAENRAHKDPYDLHFCNIDRKSDMAEAFKRHIPTMDDLDFPINVHEQSYLDLYPRDKLVYLTPHCKQDMLEYNPDEIYIIGALVDKINNEPLSLAKAKKEGIKMVKFPLDKYLAWGAGSGKSLTLNQCVSILLDLKLTGKWEYALRHVPKRKLVDEETFIQKRRSTKFPDIPKRKWTPKIRINTVFKE